MPTWAIYGYAGRSGPGPLRILDPATLAWIAAVIANGGTVSANRQILVDNLIIGLKGDGVFAKLDRLWIDAAENQASALTDMVADSLATAVNSPTFTTDRGYSGFSTTTYIDTNYNVTVNNVNFSQNSATVGGWAVTYGAVGGGNTQPCLIGSVGSGGNAISVGCDSSSSNFQWIFCNANDAAFNSVSGNGGNSGSIMAVRVNSATMHVYNDAVDHSNSATSTAVQSFDLFIGAQQNNGGPINAITVWGGQIAAGFVGGGLSSTDVTNLHNRLRTYMTAVGVP